MEKDITIDGQSLHYEVTGTGAPLILMHGWGCSLATVRSIANTAAKTHTVYNIDLPGFGQSKEPASVWGIDEYTSLIEKFIKTLALKNVVLAGHSFGGRISILAASRNNDINSIILIDAAGIKPHRSLKYYFKVYSFKASKALMKMIYGASKSAQRIEAMRAKHGSSDYAQSSPRMRAILSKVVNEDLTSRLPLIKVPTLLIWGENDTATPIRDAHKMEKMIPSAGLVSFPGCGHYSFLDNPVQFSAVLTSFLKSCCTTAKP